MSSTALNHQSAPPPADPAAETLGRHFPAEARDAYTRFTQTRQPADLDIVILAIVRDHIPSAAQRSGPPPADHAALIADLGFDSVAITEMVFFVEDLFHVRISNEEILRVRTVGDLRAFVREKLATTPATQP
jgi:acyl carrier protein